jgi:WD40 repeat protein
LEIWTKPAGQRVRERRFTDGPLNALHVSANEKFLLGWDRARDLVGLWDIETGARLATFPDFAGSVAPGSWSRSQRTAFSPDDRWLAYATSNHTVKIWDLQRQEERFTLRGHIWHIECLRFSRDGSRLATGSWDAEARLWDPATGHETVTPLRGHLSGVGSLSFSSDGRTLAVRSGEDLHFWSAVNGGEMLAIPKVTAWFFNIIAPDGNAMIWEDGAFTGRFQVHYLPTLAEIDRRGASFAHPPISP